MNFLLMSVGDLKKDYPDGRSPETEARMLSLGKYHTLARRVIGKFAPEANRDGLLRSEDAVSYVAYRIMVGDWGVDEVRRSTCRGNAGKWAVMNVLRRLQESGERQTLSLDLYDPPADPKAPEPHELMQQNERKTYLRGLLGLLKPRQRYCVYECYARGRRPADVARDLGVRPQTVHKQLKSGLRVLKNVTGVSDE